MCAGGGRERGGISGDSVRFQRLTSWSWQEYSNGMGLFVKRVEEDDLVIRREKSGTNLCDNVSYHKRTKCLAVETSLLHLLRGGVELVRQAWVEYYGGAQGCRVVECVSPLSQSEKQKNVGQSP